MIYKMKQIKNIIGYLMVISFFTACNKDLNRTPTNSTTSITQYSTVEGYKAVLAKIYGSYSLTSSNGTGASDVTISGVSDVAITDFVRAYWNMQELTTDEAVCAWNDVNLQSFHNFNWTANNVYINALYGRSLYQITVCNEFIRQSSDANISSHGFSKSDAAVIRQYRAEARFLRAYQYWVLMDMFGNPPFVTEADPIGKYIPKRISRADLFTYVESELKGD